MIGLYFKNESLYPVIVADKKTLYLALQRLYLGSFDLDFVQGLDSELAFSELHSKVKQSVLEKIGLSRDGHFFTWLSTGVGYPQQEFNKFKKPRLVKTKNNVFFLGNTGYLCIGPSGFTFQKKAPTEHFIVT